MRLTDEELKATKIEALQCLGVTIREVEVMATDVSIAQAQLQKVVEWLFQYCDAGHGGVLTTRRINCPKCRQVLRQAGKE